MREAGSFSLFPALMVDSSVSRSLDVPSSEMNEGELELAYEANTQVMSGEGQGRYFECWFAATQRAKDVEYFRVEARYVILVSSVHSEVFEEEASTSSLIVAGAWSRFRDFFAIACSQAAVSMPMLPIDADLTYEKSSFDRSPQLEK